MTNRVYVWTHNWLSPIQKGIQGAHAVVELGNREELDGGIWYQDWATNHKTLVFFNGGCSADLRNLNEFLAIPASNDSDTCWSTFREDHESLEGTMTAIALLPTEAICDCVDHCRENGIRDAEAVGIPDYQTIGQMFGLNIWETDLVTRIINSRLAS